MWTLSLAFSPDHSLQLLLPGSQNPCPPAFRSSPLLLHMLCPLPALPSVPSMTSASAISASQSQAGAPLFSGLGVTEKGLFTQGTRALRPPGQNHWLYPSGPRSPAGSEAPSPVGRQKGWPSWPAPLLPVAWAPRSSPWRVPQAEEGSWQCSASEPAAPSSHGDDHPANLMTRRPNSLPDFTS